MIIATILKSGGDFKPEHVEHLHLNLLRELKWPTKKARGMKFVCLTDIPDQVPLQTIPLTENLQGAYNQIELFKPHQFTDKVMYLDLDTVVLRDIGIYTSYNGLICFNQDCLAYKRHISRYLTTNIMIWDPTKWPQIPRRIWTEYIENEEKYKAKTKKHKVSKPFFQKLFPGKPDTFTELWPGTVVSYKEHCCNNWSERKFTGIPRNARIVTYHGKPRPWDVGKGEKDLWTGVLEDNYSADTCNWFK